MIVDDNTMLKIMPHKGKMLLLSRVVDYDIEGRTLLSEFDIGESSIFFDPGLNGVPGYVCFEFMAQAISALSGLTGLILNKPVIMGFILSVSSLEINIPVYKSGETVSVDVKEEQRVDTVSTFRCRAMVGEREAAAARLMVMDVDNPNEFIKKESNER
ncbi:MAG: hypothetical protein FWG99_04120 [Treponema sp.]|nr:hypothetical protein [Treponema sp.]